MKKALKLIGIIAVVAVIGFSMAACDNGTTSGGDSLPAPTLTAQAYSSTVINLDWTAIPGAAGYNLYGSRSASSGFELLATRPTNSAGHQGLQPDTTYYYKVAAYTANGTEGAMSNVASATTLSAGSFSLNGVWESDHGIVISIYDTKAVFTNIDAFASWQEVEKRGNIKIGASYFRNINKTGDWTWSFQAQTYNVSTYELLSWAPGTITLNSNGQTFTANVPTAGGSHTFTRKTVYDIDGVWESDHGIVISIYGGKAVFTNIDAFAGWQEVEKRGNIKIGASYFRNISKTGDWTWSFQAQTYNVSTYELLSWAPGTITLNSNGQTFTANVPTAGGSHTFTRK